ncbi:TPA: hypothetical protein ACSFAA_005431 [Pseudomonas aeruginosa]|nr:hypothetical protein [Pseudomonas aeruginosa]ELK2663425.1 hypothetical protein [Pseudomonas aeruginosa]MCM8604234.1 hypothetical protein [Pseudomonas aeruginosa]MCM8645645.1 hypothetical protein [Pseudomonas aeruginosa]MCM8658618.1 hypothetical protein [Pseudomonas aeruginosa]MCM8668375.1 hypothetical protein [Pseudomonas aeruginosa]
MDDEFDAVAYDDVPIVGLVCRVQLFGRLWNSLDEFVAEDEKQGYN